ncbi:protein kinase [Nonomuraea sp. NPDC023979]|uniref:protein kinase domain-containing protein n=1 Tax=Nonomuraea sp. NPDC023979 TaxID=3154796 RepID=UPI0033C2A30D
MGQQGRSGTPLTPEDPPAIGPYELLSRLGSGGMGTVYLARGGDGEQVALKAIRRDFTADAVYRARFHEEVSNARKVASFCTARVLDHGEHDGVLYLVTEYIDGVSLEDHLIEHGSLSSSMLHSAAVGVAAALTAIHAAGLVHRDLKPANVMLTLAGPRVIDFGLARSTHVGSRHTNAGMVMGTPGWIAPEQVFEGRTSPAGDVFAWGSLIAYAGLGGHPFGEGDAYVMAARARTAPPDLRGLPAPLDRLVAAAIHPDPARRPTAKQLLLELVSATDEPAAQLAATRHLTDSWNPAEFPPLAAGSRRPGPRPAPPGPQPSRGPQPAAAPHRPPGPQAAQGPQGSSQAPHGPQGHPPGAQSSSRHGAAPPPPPPGHGSARGHAPHPERTGPVPASHPERTGPAPVPPAERSGPTPMPHAERTGPTAMPHADRTGPVPGGQPRGDRTRQGPMPHAERTGPVPSSLPHPERTGPVPMAPHRTGQGPLPPRPFPKAARTGRNVFTGCMTALVITLVLIAVLITVLIWMSRGPAVGEDGEPVRDGKLSFAVTAAKCPEPARSAKRRTCRIALKVSNVGQDARVLYPAQQKLLDADDGAHDGSRLLDKEGAEISPISIGPGKSFTGTLVFELPRDAEPAGLELHDSALSDGVRISLG